MAEAELATVARPYARAAFSTALDLGQLGQWAVMMKLLSAAVQSPEVEARLEDPALSGAAAAAVLVDLLEGDLSPEGSNFVRVLAEYDRLTLLPVIAEQFDVLKANHEKTIDVSVTSAYEMSDSEQTTLKEALHRRLQRTVALETYTDSALLGGVVIRTEDTVIDDSVRGKLEKLAGTLQ
ncbi:MAG: F0F1 ATP synthase subunit delta [Proteobacteria bacterium]|nr:F0F1 ATP synthase subunit delta [Pseudomonadota bacterium]